MLCLPTPTDSTLKRIFGAIYSGWATAAGFTQAIAKLADPLVLSTVELYQAIAKEMLPTPAKSHYTFNMRDIGKVFQGILSVKPVACPSTATMTRLWLHECERCFEDRLVNAEDKLWCTQKLVQLVQKNFGVDWRHDALFKDSFLTFCDFMNEGDKIYEEVADTNRLVTVLDSYLEQYNMAHPVQQMRLVFFQDAVKHLVRISRVIRQPRGNAMLVGVGGSGKQSLTRLACFMAEYPCHQVQVSRNFSHADFREFLKKMCLAAGVKGQHTVFLLTDEQVVEEAFLEDVNNLLNNGEVPNLFPKDELQKALEDLASVLREERMQQQQQQQQAPSPDDDDDGSALYTTFLDRIRERLHIVLCLSPVGDAFRQRLRMFPSLINCTTIDWFMPWPEEALLSVARAALADVDVGGDDVRQLLAEQSVLVHTSVAKACVEFLNERRRHVYTTPKSYLDMLGLYRTLLTQQRDKLDGRRLHLLTGLRRLKDTQGIVADLQETLEKLRPTLVAKAKETEALLLKVAVDSAKADEVRLLVEVEEKQVSLQTAQVREEEASARANLELAMPALRAAVKALDKLKKSEVSEVKSLPSPPAQVVRVLEAVCILLGETPDWESAKKVLTNVNFLKQLRDYPKENIDSKMIRKLNKYVTDPQLAEDEMYLISRAACSMMMWVQAMHTYYHVDREVAPKIARVEELKAQLDEAEARLRSKQDELAAVVANVQALQARCRETEAEKAALDDKSRQTEARLDRAQQLIELLSSEEVRWAEDAEGLRHQLQFVVGDVFVATAAVSYYGAFTGDYRARVVQLWLDNLRATGVVPVSADFSLQGCLGSPMTIRQWTIHGLPSDDVSVDSALVCAHSARWPLLIDPHGQQRPGQAS
jgi:dynein heavy chain